MKKLNKPAKQYVLYTNEFGYDIFINTSEGVVDKIENACKFDLNWDNPVIKLGYWKAVSGLNLELKYL